MSWVFDATPLIYLAKAQRLELAETLDAPRLIPEQVYREVVSEGIEAGYTDARRIERHAEDTFDVVDVGLEDSQVATRLQRNPGLSAADVAVLACAHSRDGVAVMDEATGRSAGEVEGIETRGTAYVVLSAVSNGAITQAEGLETVDAMIDEGWYIAPDLYTKIREKLEDFEK